MALKQRASPARKHAMNCGLNTACKELVTHAIETTLEKDRIARSLEDTLRRKYDHDEQRTAKIDELKTIPIESLTGNQRRTVDSYTDSIQYLTTAAYKPPYEYPRLGTYLRLRDTADEPEPFGSEDLAPNVTLDYGSRDVTLHIRGLDSIRITYAAVDGKQYIELGASEAKCLATSAYLAVESDNYEPFYDQLVTFVSNLFPFKPGEVDLRGYDNIVNHCNQILRCEDQRLMKRHILLAGPPGCGKSMIAKKVVKDNPEYVPFYLTRGGNGLQWFEFFSKIIHKCNRRMLLVVDEIDELGLNRDDDGSPVFELLRLMDGAEDVRGLTILATTNRPQVLDEALLRPGRFGPGIRVEAPNPEQTRAIISYYNVKYGSGVDPEAVLADLRVIPSGAFIRMAMEDCIIKGVPITAENVTRNLEATL